MCPAGYSCGTTIDANMITFPASWSFNGSASWTPGSGQLTPSTSATAGTIVYRHPILLGGTFKVRFQMQLGDGDGGGFMVETTGATAVGADGGGLGMNGLGGFAVELDTWQNGCDPDDDHVGVDSLSTTCSTETGTLSSLASEPLSSDGIQLHDGQWHQIEVTVENFSVTVVVDGATTPLWQVPVPPIPATTPVWLGFAGSTGQAIANQGIRNVTIAFPGPTCL